MDVLWLIFLGCLAALKPEHEIHKQLVLLAIGLFQILEHRFLNLVPSRGQAYSVIIKIGLATLLVAHTGNIESSYYLIYYLPVVTAAMAFGIWATLGWTLLASGAYCSFLILALRQYRLTASGATELAINNIFFFLAAVLVNRLAEANRQQAERYRHLAEELAETNRQLERAQADARRSERLAALGQLSAGLAHEIRNPLAVIRGSAETLERQLTGADAISVELAGYISSEVNRLNVLVSRFLDFARPARLELRPSDVVAVIERALKAARERWPAVNVQVETHFPSRTTAVPLDADLAERVFINLIFNAYEAMPGGGTLRVTVSAVNQNGRRGVAVDIEDSGPGVPAENREAIFNPFFTTKESGVGLGLAIVSKIMDEHGGRITLESPANAGTRFRLFFPAE